MNTNKPLLITLGAFALIAVTAFLTYFFVTIGLQNTKESLDNITHTDTPTDNSNKAIGANPSLNEDDSWQTYTNEEYGFSFKYPNYLSSECCISESLGDDWTYVGTWADESSIMPGTDKGPDGLDIYVKEDTTNFNKIIELQKSKLIENYIATLDDSPNSLQDEAIELSNVSGVLLKGYTWWNADLIFIKHPYTSTTINIVVPSYTPPSFINNILSTFEFSN